MALRLCSNRPHLRKTSPWHRVDLGSWNYPLMLVLRPLVRLAAGNTAVLKPSEQAPAGPTASGDGAAPFRS